MATYQKKIQTYECYQTTTDENVLMPDGNTVVAPTGTWVVEGPLGNINILTDVAFQAMYELGP